MTSSLTGDFARLNCDKCGFKHDYLRSDGYPSLCPRCGAEQPELITSQKAEQISALKAQLEALQGTGSQA